MLYRGIYLGYIGIMEKKMETTIWAKNLLGFTNVSSRTLFLSKPGSP